MKVWERELELRSLRDAFASVSESSRGQFVVVVGEPGIGKTTLIRQFCDQAGAGVRVLWGSCEPLVTPSPLAPLLELAAAAGPPLEEAVARAGTPYSVAAALERDLRSQAPTILVLEDVHWADDATLDVLRIVARRYEQLPVMIVVSHRRVESEPRHPLRRVLGDVRSTDSLRRLPLAPLSLDAVSAIAAEHGADGEAVYARTGGNPFFVAEAVQADDELPATVREAVLARAAQLGPRAWSLLEAVAICAMPAELTLLDELAPGSLAAADECVAVGLIEVDSGLIRFRHELARLAVVDSIGPVRSIVLHRAAAAALERNESASARLARLAQHAEAAGDTALVLEYAPAAAARAAAHGAHHAAAAEYARALRFADRLPRDAYADLCLRRSVQCYVVARDDEAEEAVEQALAAHRELGDRRSEGAALSWLALVLRNAGRAPEAWRMVEQSIATLEALPPGRDLAAAYATAASVALLAEDARVTTQWAVKAEALAHTVGDDAIVESATVAAAAARALCGAADARGQLEAALADALDVGSEDKVGRARTLLGMAAYRERSLTRMEEHSEAGLQFCEERGLAVWSRNLLAMRSWVELERCAWDDAARTVSRVISLGCTLSIAQAKIVLALLRARRGDPDPASPLDEVAAIVESNDQLWWTGQLAAARAEVAWLAGKPEQVAAVTETAYRSAQRVASPWVIAELALWRRRGGIVEELPTPIAGPFALELRGEWPAAAAAWRESGSSYEAALALAGADDEPLLRQSLEELQQLGAHPAAAIVARRLRSRGARALPRGPRRSTKSNPLGLTRREADVLELLAEGLTNREIATRLYLSARTVDSHVAAILRKLGASTRAQAVHQAQRRSVLQ